MAQKQLIRHGTRAGYDAELASGASNVCDRCRAAKRVYQSQYYKVNKGKIHYGTHDVIDHLDKQRPTAPRQAAIHDTSQIGSSQPSVSDTDPNDMSGTDGDTSGSGGLRERLSDALFTLKAERKDDTGYVPIDEPHDYVHPIESDAESAPPRQDEFVITAENVKAIKDNLGMYLITAGMTLQLIDPYCGNVLRENLDDMVDGWARVIMHYPSAAKLFMARGGGKIMAWLDALMATWPILLAIYEHHLSHTVTIDSRGYAVRVNKAESPNGQFATQPNYDQYPVD